MRIQSNSPDSETLGENLSPPDPVKPVDQESAARMVKLDGDTLNKLDLKVDSFLKTVLSKDLHSEEFKEKIANIHSLGNEEIRASARISGRLLDNPIRAMHEGFFNENSTISRALISLRNTVEDLDPARQGDLLAPKKLFGLIPIGNKLRDYFRKYHGAQSLFSEIIQSLYEGKEVLQKDNAAIEEEKVTAWDLMRKMEQYVYVGKKLDAALEVQITLIEVSNVEKARVLREEMLFYVRQKVQDLLTQLAVTAQGYLAMEMIRRNNLELIKGVDRATTITVSALRTAVMVAQALTNQKLVMEQILRFGIDTANMMESTSNSLKTKAPHIQQQTSGSVMELDKLKKAFLDIFNTMDMMSDYRVKALNNMKQTVDFLYNEVEKAKKYSGYVDEARGDNAKETTQSSQPPDGEDIHI